MDDDWNPNALIVCPYDEVHVVAVTRFQRHILKCRKNHPDKDIVTCPYNASHIVLRDKLRSHLGSCPDQRAIDPDVIQAQNDETGEVERLMGKIDLPERTWVSPAESEDWDQEALNYEEEKGKGNFKNGSRGTKKKLEQRGYRSHVGRVGQKETSNEDLTTYVRMAGRGFKLNSLDVPEKQGVGRGTLFNRR